MNVLYGLVNHLTEQGCTDSYRCKSQFFEEHILHRTIFVHRDMGSKGVCFFDIYILYLFEVKCSHIELGILIAPEVFIDLSEIQARFSRCFIGSKNQKVLSSGKSGVIQSPEVIL